MIAAGATRPSRQRILWLDIARGIALVAMAIYHFSWDLELFGYLAPGTAGSGFLKWFARSIAASFLLLVGISLVLAHGGGIRWRSFAIRLAQIAAAASLISVATYFATPDAFIYFGILHHIALASVIGVFMVRWPLALLIAAIIAVIAIEQSVQAPIFNPRWLAWTGLGTVTPRSNDFVPLFPWFAYVLTGIVLGRLILRKDTVQAAALPGTESRPARILSFLGRNSLVTYLVHQPVLIAIVFAMTFIVPPGQATGGDGRQAFFSACMNSCNVDNDENFCVGYCACATELLADDNQPVTDPALTPRHTAVIEECTRVGLEDANER